MRLLAVFAILFSAAACASQQGYPVNFTSDGCSNAPDGPLSDRERWQQACAIHDYRYWRGGTPLERLEADRELATNIAATGHPLIAQVYKGVVRFGGSPWLPTSYRWGYGWAYPRGYGYLSNDEQAALDRLEPGPPE